MNDLLSKIENYSDPLIGVGLPSNNLKELIHSEKMLILHFLRHLGCMFCKHSVDELYKLKQNYPQLPTIYFIHQSNLDVAEKFFAEHFPGARHISDTKLALYKIFQIKRVDYFNPSNFLMLLKGIRLLLNKYKNQIIDNSDITLLSGTFLFYEGKLVWQHRASYAGDDPNWNKIKF
ncbi:MAG: hypothetical protein RML72_00680 [Bacteroidia bacterium]|nr:hypothetical protein [Bacteroidia bacterium]MDW8157381.1 hypothetical protein [Bacteroidia bacterium]